MHLSISCKVPARKEDGMNSHKKTPRRKRQPSGACFTNFVAQSWLRSHTVRQPLPTIPSRDARPPHRTWKRNVRDEFESLTDHPLPLMEMGEGFQKRPRGEEDFLVLASAFHWTSGETKGWPLDPGTQGHRDVF